MILINKTFSEVTPESAEDGEMSDSGFVFEDVAYGFRELVQMMRDYPQPSSMPARGNTHEWLSNDYSIEDYRTGTERQESIHYSRANPAHNARYWRLAMVAAGMLKPLPRGSEC